MARESRSGEDYPFIRFKKVRPSTGLSEMLRGTTYGKNIQEAMRNLLGGSMYHKDHPEKYNFDYTLVYKPRLRDSVKQVELIRSPVFFGLNLYDSRDLEKDPFRAFYWRAPRLYDRVMLPLIDPETGEIRFQD